MAIAHGETFVHKIIRNVNRLTGIAYQTIVFDMYVPKKYATRLAPVREAIRESITFNIAEA